jgi:hypothetical protein
MTISLGASETTLLRLKAKEKEKTSIMNIAFKLLGACLTLPYGCILSNIPSLLQVEDYNRGVESIHIGLVSSLSLHLYYSRFPAAGHHPRSPTIASAPTPEYAEYLCDEVPAQNLSCVEDKESRLIDLTTFQHHQRSRTRIFSSEVGEGAITGSMGNPSRKLHGRSMEETIANSKDKRPNHPIKSHLIQQWNRLRSKVRSASSSGKADSSPRFRTPADSSPRFRTPENDQTASTRIADATSKDHAAILHISPLARRPVERTQSAPVTIQLPKKAPQRADFNLLITPSPDLPRLHTESSTSTEESKSDDAKPFLIPQRAQCRPSLGGRMFSEPLQRRSTAATVVYKPPIIAQASPNSERLTSIGNSSNSSSGSSLGLTDRMNFL